LEGSPFPGEAGNVVIAGHRDTHFRVLKNVLIGDQIHIGTDGEQYVYRIVDIRIVRPGDTWVLEPQSQPTLTLITCYPFGFVGSAPDRYVVQAALVEP
jgi:sortase A